MMMVGGEWVNPFDLCVITTNEGCRYDGGFLGIEVEVNPIA